MTTFSPFIAFAGGVLIGLAAALLWWLLGRIAGVSSILARAIGERDIDGLWRWAFLFGLIGAGLIGQLGFGHLIQFRLAAGYGQIVLAGLLVGVGTQMSGGCTSGHGVCGISRLSPRSIVATGCFMLTGMVTVFLIGALT